MNIIVCLKQVPSTTKVDIDPETGVMKRDGVDSKMNPYDLYAIEAAMLLKSYIPDSHIRAISMGPKQASTVIMESFMMGVDSGYLVSDRRLAGSDVLATAYSLSQAIKSIGIPDLIICGQQSTDGDTAQVGAELAELLSIPNISYISKIISVGKDHFVVEYETDDYAYSAKIKFPSLISVTKNIADPRLPSYNLKVKNKNNPIKTLNIEDFDDKDEGKYGINGSPTQVVKIFPPKFEKSHKIFTGDSEKLSNDLYSVLKENKII